MSSKTGVFKRVQRDTKVQQLVQLNKYFLAFRCVIFSFQKFGSQ